MNRYFAAGACHVVPPQLVFHHTHGERVASSAALTVQRRNARRRANTAGARYRLADVADRDHGRCHLCGKKVDMSLSGRHPMGPTADHLIPVAAGGGDEPHNIALAHRRCNVKRGVGGVAQLRLVG